MQLVDGAKLLCQRILLCSVTVAIDLGLNSLFRLAFDLAYIGVHFSCSDNVLITSYVNRLTAGEQQHQLFRKEWEGKETSCTA